MTNKAMITNPNDPWKHRSANMCCATCMWYVPKLSDGGTVHLGRCRRRAPTMAGYPAVFEADWCGDHKLDENKLTTMEKQNAQQEQEASTHDGSGSA
mgnify:CR=1 FL=1